MKNRTNCSRIFLPGQEKTPTKNRVVMGADRKRFMRRDGEITDKTTDYYAERARGGQDLLLVHSHRVRPCR